ncbi:gastrula zinc finger protein XlCGF7.1-like isoform X2 [Ptychodera flava]|uniref:gastrula zinc finger protein XlCGF7.1-like isoform X2 n=1 Tax=Ptychodera flava TaxID=63121 RepID=UPI00396A06FE
MEIMNKDCPLSDFEPCERSNCNGGSGTGSALNNNCGVPQACQDASIIVQSIMQNCCITLEYSSMSNRENSNEDLTPWYEGNHIEHRSTLHKDSFHLMQCHSHNGDSYDGEISTECGENCGENSNDGAHSLNSRAQEIECGESAESYSDNMYLKGLAVIHSDLTPFQHSECSETFIQNDNHEIHELTNSNIRPYKCEECDKTFTDKSGLKSHMLSHSEMRPHQCGECGKSFKRKHHVLNHMLIHSGVRPHNVESVVKHSHGSAVL